MKTWNEVVVGDKVMARGAIIEVPTIIYGQISEVKDEFLTVIWEKPGWHTFTYAKEHAKTAFYFYETEAEKLAIALKIL